MNVWVLEILFCRSFVVFSTEADKSLLTKVADVGLDWGDHHIEPKVKFFILQQQGIINIRLHDPLSGSNFWDIADFFYQNYAISLATGWGLGYECASIVFYLFRQCLLILWEKVGLGVKPKLLRPVFPELIENESHGPLVAKVWHRRNSINSDLSCQINFLIGQS